MAIEIKINPIDFELDVAIGIDLPMMGSKGSAFKQNYLTIDQSLANVKNLLLTNKGERVMQPDLGCDLKNILFENITEDLLDTIDNTIRNSISFWLPYIFINKLTATADESNNHINISLAVSLIDNIQDTRAIQITITDNTQPQYG